ncbi:NAD(P)H-binding protein, partial [Streptomyces antimycoticus]
MRIAVTTPTGNVGRHVVATLVRAGVRPRVLLRDPARLAPEVRDAVDAVPVDQYDADAVVAATTDIDALFW